MYNVLARLRAGKELSKKEQAINEQGLCTVLRKLHDDLDQAVLDAYGWPYPLDDQEVLARLVALNRDRSAEEAQGTVRWLRPNLQNPTSARQPVQVAMAGAEPESAKLKKAQKKQPWPRTLVERVQAVQATVATLESPSAPKEVARYFRRAKVSDVSDLLETLHALGQVHKLDDGKFTV